ncbi:MAG TPA: hypothetical protein VMU10_05290 [Desulfomonilia bacterium]|nr:hypothetical protein [Desulfomonilia bacterium]
MKHKKSCYYHTPSNEQGLVLAFVLMLLAVTLGLTLASASMVLYHLKSSNAFYRIMKNQFLSPPDETSLSPVKHLFGAPEGWDSICFMTEINEYSTDALRAYSWRVTQREQCPCLPDNIISTVQRPHIVVVIDDSTIMSTSSGQDYRDDALYLKSPAGGAIDYSDTSEITDSRTCTEGMYFTGKWGNSHERAPDQGSVTGAMSLWTKTLSYARSLIDSLELCSIAVTSTSRGTIRPFTRDWQVITAALDSVYPVSSTAPLSDALYQATKLFPSPCATGKHIILVTAGIPVNDCHLPTWLRDYDHDGNPADTFYEKEGSHCLDDVAAYAKSLGISVHVIGPDTGFLRSIASKGGGQYMPGRDLFTSEQILITQPLLLMDGRELTPSNFRARIDPPWLNTAVGKYYRSSVENPLTLVSCPVLPLYGLADYFAANDIDLYVTTAHDRLLKITMPAGDLSWLIIGMGGPVLIRGDLVVSGPNRKGFVSCIGQGPRVLWQQKGTCMDASLSEAYIGDGTLIGSYHLEDGSLLAQYDITHPSSVIRYDPCTGNVFAGTTDGLIYLFTKRLEPAGMINATTRDPVLEIRPFTWRKHLHLITACRTRIESYLAGRMEWSVPLEQGAPTGMAVMDSKVFLTAWSEDASCGGIDTGVSTLLELDALTGNQLGAETMFTGRAYGPSLDLLKGAMKFISPSGTVYEKDISKIPGVVSCPLGRQLISHTE